MILCSVGPAPGGLVAPELCRLFAEAGHQVEVVLENRTAYFIGPAAFTGNGSVVQKPTEIPQALVFASATSETIARLARNLTESYAEEAYASGLRPAILAPSVDEASAKHPAVLENLDLLKKDGCQVVHATAGSVISAGDIAAATFGQLGGLLRGKKVLVTAGGTREPIDSVRFVGNRSSGKMGLAIAREAIERGASVTVVAANVEMSRESGVEWVPVETVDQMSEAVSSRASQSDALIMAAAVSDFKPATMLKEKVRRSEGLSVEFVPTEDILRSVRERNPELFMVGFSATHGDPRPDSRDKLRSKGVDIVVGNDISQEGIGFAVDDNEVYIVTSERERFVPRASKREIARAILGELQIEIEKERQR